MWLSDLERIRLDSDHLINMLSSSLISVKHFIFFREPLYEDCKEGKNVSFLGCATDFFSLATLEPKGKNTQTQTTTKQSKV